MAQWSERSPPNIVARVRFRHGVICGVSLVLVLVLLRDFFSRFSGFPPPQKPSSSLRPG